MFLIIQPTGDIDHCDVLKTQNWTFYTLYYIILYIIYYKRKYIYKCKYTNVLDLNSSLYLAKFFIPTLISESVSMPSPKKRQRQVLLLELHLHSLSRCLMMNWHNVSQPLSMILTHLCCLKMITAILTQKSQYKIWILFFAFIALVQLNLINYY